MNGHFTKLSNFYVTQSVITLHGYNIEFKLSNSIYSLAPFKIATTTNSTLYLDC